MFGLSFGELCMLLLVAVVVLGPKELPRYLRKAGQVAGRLRSMAYDMRQKSGIDEVLRTEGIDQDIAEIRKLARGEIAGVVASVRSTADLARMGPGGASKAAGASQGSGTAGSAAGSASSPSPAATQTGVAPYELGDPLGTDLAGEVASGREYPKDGADAYSALPDTAAVYDGALPPSPLAEDALYTRGETA